MNPTLWGGSLAIPYMVIVFSVVVVCHVKEVWHSPIMSHTLQYMCIMTNAISVPVCGFVYISTSVLVYLCMCVCVLLSEWNSLSFVPLCR